MRDRWPLYPISIMSFAAILLVAVLPAGAGFPGVNGQIAFVSSRDGNLEIYVMNADGGGLVRLTTDAAVDFSPAWSPDGSRITFFSNRDGTGEIYAMNADGTGVTQLTTAGGFEPAWSPDGNRIAFRSNRDGNPEIYVMNADGTVPTRITTNAAFDDFPAWSPDGTRIAFFSNRDGSFDIYVMNADGSFPTNLTFDPAVDLFPDWSPDGTKIAFRSSRDGNSEVYVMAADGSAPTRVTNNPASDDVPAWAVSNLPPAASLTLDPPVATNPVNAQHCVTATVEDAAGNPVAGVTVRFTVIGAVNTSGSATTDANGQAMFCYTGPSSPGADAIGAFADADNDATQDPEEPSGAAGKTWILPLPTLADQCRNDGWMTFGVFKNQGDCIQYVNTGK